MICPLPDPNGLVVERYKKDNTTFLWGVRHRFAPRYWKSYMYLNPDPKIIFRYVHLRVSGRPHKEICKVLWRAQQTVSQTENSE